MLEFNKCNNDYLHTGMSEGTGPIISNIVKPGCWKIGSVGKPYPGVELMLHNKDEHGEGEVSGV